MHAYAKINLEKEKKNFLINRNILQQKINK